MNPQNECISNCTNRYVTCEKNYRHPFVLNKRDRKAHIHNATTRLAPVSVLIVGLCLVLLLHLLPTPACLKEMSAWLSVPNATKPNEQSDVRLMMYKTAIWTIMVSHSLNAIFTWHNARQQLFQTADLALYSHIKLRASTFTTDYL